jgi:hypothetical protein
MACPSPNLITDNNELFELYRGMLRADCRANEVTQEHNFRQNEVGKTIIKHLTRGTIKDCIA